MTEPRPSSLAIRVIIRFRGFLNQEGSMQTRQLSLFLSLLLTLCLFHDTQAQQAGQIESMKLLTADTGWAATRNTLFWTADGGASWKDITPKLNHKHQILSSVFFLDVSRGWALISCSDDHDIAADNSCFALASTADAGETWSVAQEKIAHAFSREQLEDGYGFSGRSWLDFVGSQHGWEILDIATNSANPSAGEMLRTVDGGKTWTPTKDTPTSDHFIFMTPTGGWIAGGKDQEVFVTHDSGDAWQKVSLPKPSIVGPDTGIGIDLPVFVDEHRGLLLARYAVGPLMGPDLSTLVLFATADGGRTWKEERILSKLPEIYSSDLAGSILIAAHSEQVKAPRNGAEPGIAAIKLSLYTLGPNQNRTSNAVEVSSQGAAIQLTFVDGDQGWANLTDRLLATRDAGKTWVDVTPGKPAPGSAGALLLRTHQ
jgi:photosystem II stability/assembly factor-like uncharacterized protein